MTFYYFMLQRYRPWYQQARCFAIFLGMILPAFFLLGIFGHYSNTAFHLLLFGLGWVTWTFAEYILHRFWMHGKEKKQAFLARSHQHHHSHPTEIMITAWQRLCMLVALALFILVAVRLNNSFTFLTGLVTGIVGYFHMHKLLHSQLSRKFLGRLVRYHIYHHCKYPNTCFGITVPWWDDLFNTVPRSPKISDRILDFYFHEDHQ